MLGTYIDALQIHRLDQSVPIEETMRALNDIVKSGKVRHTAANSVSGCEAQTSTMHNTFQAYIRGLTNHGETDGGMGVPDAAEYR